eukprot:TRINITY_DN9767_c0_g1_i1.p1 TRINITY_DN9767_c0_g1~~TRINITY_DN9767_c0_g1_i1.p1  ORF type:complete len:166 (+),score=38.06 TRINITY_DN9767_c0_g1_i1:136-633(+)
MKKMNDEVQKGSALNLTSEKKISRPHMYPDIDGVFLGSAGHLLDLESGVKKECLGPATQIAINVPGRFNHPKGSEVSKSKANRLSEKTGWKKSPRPPRAPNSCSASKERSIKGSFDSAMLRRAKLQKLRRQKLAAKGSSRTSLVALLITLLFCAILIFQGDKSEV